MSSLVVLFLDGIGLGADDPAANPLAAAHLPTLAALLDGRPLTASQGRIDAARATMIPTDATLGVPGRPQSATGQTALLTGLNAPALVDGHYGPRPSAALRSLLEGPTLFSLALAAGKSVAFANAYPQGYFDAVARGKRLHGAIPHAAQAAGVRLRTAADLAAGEALSVDLTNAAWRSDLGYPDMPVWTAEDAGRVLAGLSAGHDLVFFDHWGTDVAGHRGDVAEGVRILEAFDACLAGLLAGIDLERTLVAIISDHGNLEDVHSKGHTTNPVPTVLIGAGHCGAAAGIASLVDLLGVFLGVLNREF